MQSYTDLFFSIRYFAHLDLLVFLVLLNKVLHCLFYSTNISNCFLYLRTEQIKHANSTKLYISILYDVEIRCRHLIALKSKTIRTFFNHVFVLRLICVLAHVFRKKYGESETQNLLRVKQSCN